MCCSQDLHSHGSTGYWHGWIPNCRVARKEETVSESDAVTKFATSLFHAARCEKEDDLFVPLFEQKYGTIAY
jgi:hypothetical protein